MKSEHRHELKTNELAQWLGNLPQWTKQNLKMIIYLTIVALLVVGVYIYNNYKKNVVDVSKQVELTTLMAQLPNQKLRILQSQAQGFDLSINLLESASRINNLAQNEKNSQMSALALIKKAEILRTELHYRAETTSSQDITNSINKARDCYKLAIEKSDYNTSLKATAEFGLGLCDEELGNFDAAKNKYQEVVDNPNFQATKAARLAKLRLKTMGDYKKKIIFKSRPKAVEEPAHSATFSLPDADINVPNQ